MRPALPKGLEASLQRCLSDVEGRAVTVRDAKPMAGGCIHNSVTLSTDVGESFFLKWYPSSSGDAFAAEADGLAALAGAQVLRVPAVVGHSRPDESPSWLLLELVPHGPRTQHYWRALGRGLAELHRARSGAYGWERPNYIGSLPQANDPTEGWGEFWWTRRLLPQLTLAREGTRLPGRWEEWKRLESRLEGLTAADGLGPSLLHGDLWSGNVFPGPSGEPTLVDPAVYRGHAEVDLAMTDLFGGFPPSFHQAYAEVRPVADGYREIRRPLYQLYPLLVHVNLFGRSYVDATQRTLAQVLRNV